ncbi:tandem-95 repeat protein [Vibrio campbellii]|uniref:tandem-95 repeat protein n=1 Tax=Vibrio campbellii TaxID=680 RepID=UPI0040572DA0
MDRTSLVSFGGQLVVVGLDGKLRTLIENEQPLQGEVIVARNDAEPISLNVQLVKENGVQDVSDDVAQILGALEAGQDPTQLGDEFASAAGQSDGSSLQTSGTVDRIGAELLADTGFETIGLESLGFSQTQILSLNELYLNTLRGNETSPAVEPAAPVAGDDIVQTDEDSAIIIDVLANDEDADSENLFIESATVPEEQGTVEIEDGKLIFTPAEDFNGDADITYVVSDGELEDEASVTVTVNPLNDAPVANDDNVVTDEDTPVTIDVLPNDTDVDGDTLSIVNASVPADQGTVEIVDGKLVFTPADNFNGEATISYTVSDGELEDSAQVSVTVNPVNDAPVANDDSAVTDEDTPVTIDVLPNDTDIDGDTLTIVNASVPADQGTVEIVDGKLVFTPAENFNGEATISYTVSDGELEDSAEVSVTVNPINDAPVANDDSAATDEDTPVTIDVLTNDTDVDGDTLTIVNASVPADQGTVEIVDGKLVFTPAENFNGEATISYTVSDGAMEDSAEVLVTVNPINDAPVANDDNVVTDEDTPVTIDVLPNDTDVDGDTLTIVNASVPDEQGTVEIVDGKLVFTPAENFNGEATISYTVSDGVLEDSAEVSVTVNPINDAPVANDDSAVTDEDTPVTIDVLTNDTDVDGDTLSIVNASVPADQGTVEIVDGKLVFTPADNFNGEATISYTVSDGALEDSAEVSVTVNPVNDAPVANDDSAVTDEDTPVTIDILPNDTDVDGDTLTIVNASVPVDQGTVEIVDGKLVFTPAENFNGEATISYTVSDGELEDSAEVSVTVNPINDAPVANDDNAVTDEDTPVTIDVLPNDTDIDGDTLTIVNASVPADQGTVEIVDGKLVFTPAENFNGEATISYTVSDGELEDSAEVTVTVNPINDAPVANDDNVVTDEDTPVTINVLPNDTDVDGDTLTIVNASVPADQGTVEIVDGKLVFTPADNFSGEATISYTVSDGELEDSAEVSVTVNPINDAPVANDDNAVTDEDTPVTINVLPNDTDIDGDTLSIVNASVPADQGTVEIVDGKLVFTPAENFNGEATISYMVSDGELEDSAEVSVTVNPLNDAPVANDDSAATDEDTPVTIDVLTNDTDVDGDTLTIVNASVPAEQGTVEIVDGKLVFTPAENFNGEATISYTVSDGVLEDSAEVSVTVNPINDVPTVENTIADQSLEEDFTPYTIDLNDAFSDVDNADGELTFSVSGNSNIQVSIVDGIATITPTADWNGSEELTFTAEDPSGETVSQVVDFTVAAVADIVSDSADIVEDTPTKLDVLGNDNFEGDAPVVTVEAGHEPTNGTVVVNNDGTITYTPNQDYNGPDQFTYTVTSGGVTETTTVTLNVTPVNDKPVVENTIADQSLEEDFTPYTIDLNDAFSDVDNADGELTFSVSGNSNVQVSIVDGIATITPTADWNGSEELTFTAEDPSGETVSQVVDFTVAAVADIVSDSADIVEDTPTKLDVLGNDNFEGDAPVVSVEAGHEPTNGTVVVNNDGTITYTPNQDYNGPDQFTYTVTSGGVTETTTVTLNVTPVNDKPVVENTIADQSLEEDFTPYTIDLNDAFSDVDNADGELTFSVSGNSNIQVSIVDGIATITPTADWNGSEELTFTAEDPSGETVSQVVDFTVAAVADIVSDSADIVEDTPTKLDVLGNDNFEGDAPVVSVEAGHEPTNGTVVVNNDGTVTYTPNQDYNGPDQFTYTVTSGDVTETTTVTLNVTPVNDKPVVENTIAEQSLEEDFTPYTIDLNDAFSDVDNADGELTFSVSGNSNIQVSIVDGIATITPTADWNGSEELTFTAEDPSGETVSQVVDFTVAAVADIVSDSADIVEDTPTKLDVLGNDNFEGDAPVVTVEAGHEPTNGTVVVNNDGTITYTPNQDYNGPDQFTYTVTSGGVTETTTVTLNVTPVNDKPVVENTIADQSLEEDFTPYTIDLNDAFSDVDNADGELTFSVSGNSNIQVSIVDGIATITPTADWNGSEELTFTAEDPSGETVSQVVDFTVAAVADIVSDSADIVEDTPTKLDVLGNDNFEGDAPVVSVEAGHEPTNGTVVVNNDGTITYTPNQDYNGPDQFTYTVTSGGVTETTTVTLNVTPVNDKPVVENTIADQSLEEDFTPYTIDLNDAFSDVDNADGELTFSVSGNSNIQVSIVDGIATITPTADWNGSEELTFTAEDPSGETVSQVVDFTVAAVADIVSDSADIVEDTPTKLDVLGNDNFEGDAPVVSVEAGHEPTNGTVVMNNDGTITYTPNQDYNGPDQFTYTVSSGGVTETTTVTLNVTPVNDKPLNEDFDHSANELITNVIFDTDDKPLDEGVDSDHISDLEDDLSGDELQIRITELPTSGTLYFKDEDGDLQEITSADGTLYDKDSIYYEADNVGFLLGIKDRPDTPDGAESTTDFYNWGLSADGGESHSRTEYLVNGASIDISSDSGVLAQYNQKVSHIGHGIADNDGQGIQPGETISIDLSENPVGSVNLGLDGLGGLFEHGSNNAALITVTYQDANGAEHTQVIEFLKPEGNSMLFQETSIGYGKDYGLPEGSVITQLDFSTKTSGNWELRYVEGFPPEDSFDYVAVDSGNAESDPATVTITNEVLDGNVSEDGPSLTLIGNSVVEGEDITFSVALDEVTETTVKYPIDMLAQGSSADNADVNLSNVSFTNGVTFAGGFLIVPAGVSAFEVIVPSIDDLALENAEDMVLEIGGESGIATIQDNDSTTLSVSQVGDVNEGSDAVFTVSLSNEVQDPFVVNLKPTTDGSYTAEDADLGQMVVTYIDSQGKTQTLNVTPDGDVTIPAGITSITVTIPTKTDGVYENTESFGLTVTDNGGVTSNGAATGDANIIDAESAPTVSIAADQASVTEGGNANFTVSIDQKSDEDVVVSFTIGGDVDAKDYQAPTIYTVTIPAGQTSVALDVTTLDDGIYEGAENLTITLTDTTGADSTLDADTKEATVSIIDAQKEVLSLQNVVGLEDQFIELGIVVNDGDTSVQTVELNGIPQGSIIEIDGQASIVGSVDAIVVSIDDISSVKVKAPEHSDVNFDIAVIARDDSDTIVETGSIYVDVHPDADKPILNIGGFEQVAAIDFEDVTIKSGSWDSDIEINKVEGAGTVGQWFTSNPGQHVEVGTEGTYLPGNSTNQVMEIEGEVGDKVLYTDMDLVAGRFYNFEFDIAARTNKAHTSDMSVTLIKVDDHGNPIDGSEVVLYDFDPTTHGWHKGESITLPVEESGKYRLLFEADEADSTGAIMDNIKFTAVDNLGYEESFIKLSEIDASLQDSLDQSESLTVELTGIPVGSVLRDGEGDSANTYVVTQENKDGRIDVTDWDLSNLQVKTQDAGIFAITVIATSTERDTNKDDEHGDHIDVGGSLTAESTASINVEVIDKPTSGGDNNERPEPDYTAGEDMIDSVAYRSGFNDFNWQQSAAYVNAGNPEQNGLYDYDPSSGVSIDVGTGNDKVLMGGGDDIIYLGESHVQVQDGDISDDKFSSVLADFAATELNALTDTFGEQDQHLKIESQSKPGLDIGHGGAGDDVIFGEKGSDIVFGGTGHDTLDGGDGSDAVRGGSGNDVLIGGSGDDILIGDDGEDIFKFVDDGSGIRDGEVDTIKDFTKGEDKIDISDLLHTDDFDSIDSLLANNEIGLEADGDNLILTISESDGSSSQKVVIEGGSNQYSEFLSDGSLSPADGSAILNDLLKINNDIT